MNEHVRSANEAMDAVLELAEPASGDAPVHFQDDSDYHVDPLDREPTDLEREYLSRYSLPDPKGPEDATSEVHFV